MPAEFTDPGGLTDFTPSDWGFDWSTLFGDPYGAFSGGTPGSSFGADQFYLDTETGQTYSLAQIQGQNDLAQAFQAQFGIGAPNTNVGDPGFGTQTGQPPSPSWLTPQNLALLGIGLPTLLGIGGLIQGFSGGGNTATTVNQPTQSPTAQAAQQAALQGFQGAQQYAFGNPQANLTSNLTGQIQPGAGGLAGQLQTMAPLQQQAQISAIQGLMNQMQTNPFLGGGGFQSFPGGQMGGGAATGGVLPRNQLSGAGAQMQDPYTAWLNDRPTGALTPSYDSVGRVTGWTQGSPDPAQVAAWQAREPTQSVRGSGAATGGFPGGGIGFDPTTGGRLNEIPVWQDKGAVAATGGGISHEFDPTTRQLIATVGGGIMPDKQQMGGGNWWQNPAQDPANPSQYAGLVWNPTQGMWTPAGAPMLGGGGAAPGGGARFLNAPSVPSSWGSGQGGMTGGGNPILHQLAQQLQGYGGAQGALLGLGGLGAMNLQNPAAGALGQQAQGMAQGNLPALNPQLRAQIGQTFEPYQQDINRQLDQALRGALERSRQQGFAGGTEVFREGTPAALLAPGLAETTRQQGTLSGLRAQAELALAQSLPQQGGNLANQLFQQQLGQNQALQQAAQGYTTPMSIALSGGLNLSNLNQNIIQALGNFGQQGMGNQLDFLRAISAPLSGLSGLAGSAQAGAGSTMTQNQPFNLLSAFAPTAQLLGGIGGAMTGYGAMSGQYQNPATVRY